MRGQVGLVDDEQVALGDAGAALAGDFFARCHVDDVDGEVRELGAEGGGQVVAAAFHKHDVGVGKLAQHAVDGLQIDGAVFADGGVGAAAGFHAQDALRRKRAAHGEQALVFLGVDVVGDGDEVVVIAHGLAQHLQQRGLARAHGAANANAQWGQVLGAVGDVVQCGHGSTIKNIAACAVSIRATTEKALNIGLRAGPKGWPAWARKPGAHCPSGRWRGLRQGE